MLPDPLQQLMEYFMRLPGIGPRQASRFAYTLLDEDAETLEKFGNALKDLARAVGRCAECSRGIEKKNGKTLCDKCAQDDLAAILVVEKDQDYETIAKSGHWQDAYHVLGGAVSLLNEKSRVTDRIRALFDRLARRTKTVQKPIEIVLATSATTEGDATALYIERVLEPFLKDKKIIISRLARGISTGTEMEFADPQTLKNALTNRK